MYNEEMSKQELQDQVAELMEQRDEIQAEALRLEDSNQLLANSNHDLEKRLQSVQKALDQIAAAGGHTNRSEELMFGKTQRDEMAMLENNSEGAAMFGIENDYGDES